MKLQTEVLSLQPALLEKWFSPMTGKVVSPRVAVLHHYLKEGWQGTFDKGQLLFALIKVMAFRQLPLNAYLYDSSPSYEKRKKELTGRSHKFLFLDQNIFGSERSQYWKKKGWGTVDERIADIRTITTEELRRNAELMIENSPVVEDEYRGKRSFYSDYTPDMLVTLCETIGRDVLVEYAKKISRPRLSYKFSIGYPDILVFKNDEVRFIKVNATPKDKIWHTQAFTFEELLIPLGFTVSVCQLNASSEDNPQVPSDLLNQSLGSIKCLFMEAVRKGDTSTFKAIISNIDSVTTLANPADGTVANNLFDYIADPDASVDVAQYLLEGLMDFGMPIDELEYVFYFYFSRAMGNPNKTTMQILLPKFIQLGVDKEMIDVSLERYKKIWGDDERYDAGYEKFLIECREKSIEELLSEVKDFENVVPEPTTKIKRNNTYFNFYNNKKEIIENITKIEKAIQSCTDADEIQKINQLVEHIKTDLFCREVRVKFDVKKTSFGERPQDSYGSFFFGNPVINSKYRWPVNKDGEGLIPFVQINLLYFAADVASFIDDPMLKTWLVKNLKSTGVRKEYLQVWSESYIDFKGEQSQIRLVPEINSNFSKKNVPTNISGEISKEEEPEWFGKRGMGVMFEIRDRHKEKISARPCLELFLQEDGIYHTYLAGHIKNINNVPDSITRKIDKIEDDLYELIDVKDIPDDEYDFGHFFGGAYEMLSGENCIDFLMKGGWRVLLQFPKEFDCFSSAFNNYREQEPCSFYYWADESPVLLYRFVEGQDDPEFMLC